jgi:hypothetical protein
MPAMSTVLDQAHNAIARKLFAMKGFHHPGGSQATFLTGLAHLYNLIPYQRRALNTGKCGVEVEGGRVPTSDWMLNLQILTSGGYQCALAPPPAKETELLPSPRLRTGREGFPSSSSSLSKAV